MFLLLQGDRDRCIGTGPYHFEMEAEVQSDAGWSAVFSMAIAVLMLAILMIRTEPVDIWVLFVYPAIGALLAHVASRTSPTVEGIAWIETSTIAAACVVVLAALVNLLLLEVLYREMWSGEYLNGDGYQQFSFFALPTISVLLWWALERRLTLIRQRGAKKKILRPVQTVPPPAEPVSETERAA